jgi:hypothetical protein
MANHREELSFPPPLSLSCYSSYKLFQARWVELKLTSLAPPVEEGGGDAPAFFLSIVAVDLGFLLVVRAFLSSVEVQIDVARSGF